MSNMNNNAINIAISEFIGADVLPVTELLNKNEELSEIKLAKIMKVDVNETRRLLYKLHDQNLVKFKKKKDAESGWYTYYWKLNPCCMGLLVNKVAEKKVEQLQNRITKESSNQFFRCNDGCIRLDQHSALSYNFGCPECGQLLDVEDNSEKIVKLKENLNELVELFNYELN